MKFSLWGWKIEISRNVPESTIFVTGIEAEIFNRKIDLPGEVLPGYETFEAELQEESDSVEEREYQEEQNWLNKRKQKDGTI